MIFGSKHRRSRRKSSRKNSLGSIFRAAGIKEPNENVQSQDEKTGRTFKSFVNSGRLATFIVFAKKLFARKRQDRSLTGGTRFLTIVSLGLLAFFIWAATSEFDQVITAEAKVIPSLNLQTVQHFEGGIVSQIHVRSGEDVNQGQPLISLDPLESGAGYQTKRSEFLQALVRVKRLSAEHRGEELKFDPELEKTAPTQIDNELLLARARKARLAASLASFDSQSRQKRSELQGAEKTLSLVEEERRVVLTLVKRGLEPGLEAVRAEKTYAEAAARVNEIKAALDEIGDRRSVTIQEFRAEILTELAEASLQLSQLEQAVNVAADKTDRSIIRSPVSGVVNRLLVSTIGGVLRPGEDAVEIVPRESELLFEAKVSPVDIGYVERGQRALLKLSTFDYSIYGNLTGFVEVVGSDSVEEENGETFYTVKIKPIDAITSTGRVLELKSGMTAQIDIIAGKRSVLSYLSSPVTKTLDTAFREK